MGARASTPPWCARATRSPRSAPSCHSPHAVMKGAAESMDTVPCKACHGDIFTAYAASVHGMLRSGGLTAAPLCFNCHGAHDVQRSLGGRGTEGRLPRLPYRSARLAPDLAAECPAAFRRGVVSGLPHAEGAAAWSISSSTTARRKRRFPSRWACREFESLTGAATATQAGPGSDDAVDLAQGAESPGRRGQDEHPGPIGGAHRGRGPPADPRGAKRSAIAIPAIGRAPPRSRASRSRSPVPPASRSAMAPTRTS